MVRAMLTKINKIGTVTEVLQVADEAAELERARWSARSSWPKYKRLIRIERSAQPPTYARLHQSGRLCADFRAGGEVGRSAAGRPG